MDSEIVNLAVSIEKVNKVQINLIIRKILEGGELDLLEKAKLYRHYIIATKDSKNIFSTLMNMGETKYYFVHDSAMYVSDGNVILKTPSLLTDGYYDEVLNPIEKSSLKRTYSVYSYASLFDEASENAREVVYHETAEDKNKNPIVLFRYKDTGDKLIENNSCEIGIHLTYYNKLLSDLDVIYYNGQVFSGTIKKYISFVSSGYRFRLSETDE